MTEAGGPGARARVRLEVGGSTQFHTGAGGGGGPRDALSSRGGGCLVDERTLVADGGRW